MIRSLTLPVLTQIASRQPRSSNCGSCGLSIEETADVLVVSPSTVMRDDLGEGLAASRNDDGWFPGLEVFQLNLALRLNGNWCDASCACDSISTEYGEIALRIHDA